MPEAARGRVETWHLEEGWGVVLSNDVPGKTWVHFSAIDMPGLATLAEDEVVDLTWERANQDGYERRATWVRPIRFRDQEPTL